MTILANAHRGESTITISGKDHILRPSFTALVAAEEELGSLFEMVERASAGNLRVTEMAALIWHCLPVDSRPDREIVGAALLSMGLVEATEPVRAIFAQVLKGHV